MAEPRTETSEGQHPVAGRIFISYGRDEFRELAERLATDLTARHYDVWFDKRELLPGCVWDREIEAALDRVADDKANGALVLLMTPHAVRPVHGFCRNEVRYALERNIRVVPIMVVQVDVVPIVINTAQWLDMTDCVPVADHEARYQAKLDLLCRGLVSHTFPCEDSLRQLREALRPASEAAMRPLFHFVERPHLSRAFDAWLENREAPQVFWLTGQLGVGKSSLSTWLAEHRSESIKAHYTCGQFERRASNYRDAVRTIAWQLATQLPIYAERLQAIPDLAELCKEPDVDLLDRLIVQPLHAMPTPAQPIVISIDALDEAASTEVNTLADLLGREIIRFPSWVRFALTSTPDRKVTVPLAAWKAREIDPTSAEYGEELLAYVDAYIAPLAPNRALSSEMLQKLLSASESNWLYLSWAREALIQGHLTFETLDAFPPGLGSVWLWELERRYHREPHDPNSIVESRYKGLPRALLSVLAAACEPLSTVDYARVLGREEAEIQDVIRDLSGLLVVRKGGVRVFHYALLKWLTDESKSGEFSVCVRDGHAYLASDGWAQFEHSPASMCDYARQFLPSHLQAIGDRERLDSFVTDARLLAERLNGDGVYELARYWKLIELDRLRALCAESHARLTAADHTLANRAALGTGQLFQQAGHYSDAITYFKLARGHAHKLGVARAIGQAELSLGWCLRHIDRFEAAIDHTSAAIKLFCENGADEGAARAYSVQGICHWHLRRDMNALADLRQAEKLFAGVSDDRSCAETLNHLGIVHRSLGMYEDAKIYLERSEALSTSLKDKKALGKCLNSRGTLAWWMGDLELALEYYRKADENNEAVNQPYVAALTANNKGYIYLEKGLYRQALESFRRAQALRQGLGIESYEMLDLSGVALADYYLGRMDEAKSASQRAVTVLRKCLNAEDLERAFYNHYVIRKDGTKQERAAALRALRHALTLVQTREKRIRDPDIVARYHLVPVVKQVLDASREVGLSLRSAGAVRSKSGAGRPSSTRRRSAPARKVNAERRRTR